MEDERRRHRPAKWEIILCFAAFCLMTVETVSTVDDLMIMSRFALVFLHPRIVNLSYNHNLHHALLLLIIYIYNDLSTSICGNVDFFFC